MALALASAGRLRPEIRLDRAVHAFKADLSASQKVEFDSLHTSTRASPPTVNDVMKLTAELDATSRCITGNRRCFGPRFTNLLHTVQQYASLGDVIIGGSQNIVACSVWCIVRMTLLMLTGFYSYLEKFSMLFMTIGRSSPRYQGLALLFSQSTRLRQYLPEYFISVVRICHQLLSFSQKCFISQIKSSLTDTNLQLAAEKLDEWATAIKDEVDYLNTETLVHSSRVVSKMRGIMERTHHNKEHERNIQRRLKWLDCCTTYEYESTWKQQRKRGNATIFADSEQYQGWKMSDTATTLIVLGKLGSGKTVLAANIIDDLNLSSNDTVCYFFCRHDIAPSCQARTIIGSLCGQLLARHLNDALIDDMLGESHSTLRLSYGIVAAIMKSVLSKEDRTFIVLDGLDECDTFEVQEVLRTLHEAQQGANLLLLISQRSQGDDAWLTYQGKRPDWVFRLLNNNPDIDSFIESELQSRIAAKELVLGDPGLLGDIRETLSTRAQGMFLWVALQIDGLCLEETDESIRQALEDLPKDLTATFYRILKRSRPKSQNSYQRAILGFLLASIRPMTLQELREALAVVPADPTWDPRKQINDIHHALSSCGSLVTVAEEEHTVHLVHQSVAQFLLESKETADWNFTQFNTDLRLGEVCVTYLSYNVFGQNLSTSVVPKLSIAQSPETVARNTLANAGLPKHLARVFMKPQLKSGADIRKTLAETGRNRGQQHIPEAFEFLKYASQHWLLHTKHIGESCFTFKLWKALLLSKFAVDGLFWAPNELDPDQIHVDDDPNRFSLPARATWAIAHSHMPLLSAELRDRQGLKTICSINPSLRQWSQVGYKLAVDSAMCTRLLQISTLFRAGDVAQFILDARIDQEAFNKDSWLEYAEKIGGLALVRWTISLDGFGSLKTCGFPILERACEARDFRLLATALAYGADVNLYKRKHPFAMALDNIQEARDIALATCILKADCLVIRALDSQDKLNQLFWYLRYYNLHGNIKHFDPYDAIWRSDETAPFLTDQILHRACSNGELDIVTGLLKAKVVNHSRVGVSEETMSLWMIAALHSFSKEREKIVLSLLRSVASNYLSISSDVLIRCIQLRAWDLAKSLLSFNDNEWRMNRSNRSLHSVIIATQRSQLLHLCATCGDHAGLELLIGELPSENVHEFIRTPGFRDLNGHTPLQIALSTLTEQHPVSEEAVRSMIAASRLICSSGQHNPAICGETPNSCIELILSYLFITIQSIIHREDEILTSSTLSCRPKSTADDFRTQYFGVLEHFVALWIEHVGVSYNPKQQLLEMWNGIVQGVHALRANISTAQPQDEASTHWTRSADGTQDLIGLSALAREYIDIATVLLRSLPGDFVRSCGMEPIADLLLTDQAAKLDNNILGLLGLFDDLNSGLEMAQYRPTCKWTLDRPTQEPGASVGLSELMPFTQYSTPEYNCVSEPAEHHSVPAAREIFRTSHKNSQEASCLQPHSASNRRGVADDVDTQTHVHSNSVDHLPQISRPSTTNRQSDSQSSQESHTHAQVYSQQTMRATIIQHLGPPSVLTQVIIPRPVPLPGEVLIRVRAFGVNSIYMRGGKQGEDQWSPNMAQECVGTVEEYVPLGLQGNDMEFFSGTKVAAVMSNLDPSRSGSYGEFVAIPVSNVISLDTNLPWEDLAALPQTYAASYSCVFTMLDVKKGETLLIRGAMSTLGRAALHLAVDAGAEVTATTRREAQFETLKCWGAASVVFEQSDLGTQFQKPMRFNKVLNLIGNSVLLESTHLTRVGGRVLQAGHLGGQALESGLNPMQIEPGVQFSLFARELLGSPGFPLSAVPLQEIVHKIEAGRWEAKPAFVFEYDDIVAAHTMLESRLRTTASGGKIVVKY